MKTKTIGQYSKNIQLEKECMKMEREIEEIKEKNLIYIVIFRDILYFLYRKIIKVKEKMLKLNDICCDETKILE